MWDFYWCVYVCCSDRITMITATFLLFPPFVI